MATSLYMMVSLDGDKPVASIDEIVKHSNNYRLGLTQCAMVLKAIAGGNYLGSAVVGVGSSAFVKASGTATFSSTGPTNGQTCQVGLGTITFVTSGATGNQVNLSGGVIATQCADMAALINTSSTFNTMFSAVATTTTVVVTCRMPGAFGNHITFTESLSNVTFSGSGFLTSGVGGLDDDPVTYTRS